MLHWTSLDRYLFHPHAAYPLLTFAAHTCVLRTTNTLNPILILIVLLGLLPYNQVAPEGSNHLRTLLQMSGGVNAGSYQQNGGVACNGKPPSMLLQTHLCSGFVVLTAYQAIVVWQSLLAHVPFGLSSIYMLLGKCSIWAANQKLAQAHCLCLCTQSVVAS